MISDVLADTEAEINRYLNDPVTSHCYKGSVREDITKLLASIAAVRATLDQGEKS